MFIYGEYNLFSNINLENVKNNNVKEFCKNENFDFYYLKSLITNSKNNTSKIK